MSEHPPVSREAAIVLIAVLAVVMVVAVVAGNADARYHTQLTQIRFANAYCESAGDPHAIGYRGWYRGKWQFDQTTWDRFAPWRWKGADPAWAPEWVQDWTALHVTYDAWPAC